MTSQKHIRAANKSIRAAGLDEDGVDASLCEFLRDAARQIDEKGMEGVSARLISAYLSAQKDVARAAVRNAAQRARDAAREASGSAVPAAPAPAGPPKLEIVKESALDRIRNRKARAS